VRRWATSARALLCNTAMTLSRAGKRFLRRRRVGAAYDMAKEIATYIPAGARVLDVGCGRGYIAHQLGAFLGGAVQGTDLAPVVEAPIAYQAFDGATLPFASGAFDVVLFCYMLHHARDARILLDEAARVVGPEGMLVIYEDTPRSWIDRLLCRRHERQWRARTGPCTFRPDASWRQVFTAAGLFVRAARRLSRLRDWSYPVARSLYVLARRPAVP
jgi:SAM-dependent methyltransferase